MLRGWRRGRLSQQHPDAKQREQRHDNFMRVLACVSLLAFFLGALYGPLDQSPSVQEDVHLSQGPVPFYLERTVSKLANTIREQQRRLSELQNRKKVKLFIGIFTTPSLPRDKYAQRRKAIMDTYLTNLTALADVETKFVVGRSSDRRASYAFSREVAQQPSLFLHLDMEAVHEQYDADWILKIDDDVYLEANRILLAVNQWQQMEVDYVGCMQHGNVLADPKHRWYEPAWRLLGPHNSLSAYGSVYALRQSTVSNVIIPNIDILRFLANEDTTIGQWLAAFNVTFFEDMRMCHPRCHPHAIAISTPECTGLCDPVKDMYKLHNTYFCQRAIVDEANFAYMKSYRGHEYFDLLKLRKRDQGSQAVDAGQVIRGFHFTHDEH